MSAEKHDTNGDSDINGFLFLNNYIPAEVIVNILSFLTWEDLLSCRLVCNFWEKIINKFVGFEKVRKFHKSSLNSSFTRSEIKFYPEKVPFYLYFAIGRNIFGFNHLKNPFGKVKFQHECRPISQTSRHQNENEEWIHRFAYGCPNFRDWNLLQSSESGWVTEDPPIGCDPIPNPVGTTSCFVISDGRSLKEQIITLQQCGLNSKIMDEIQPHIEVSEWFAKRWDCGILYEIQVTLLNTKKEMVDDFTQVVDERQGDTEWHQVSHTFKDYGPGVRYILFRHGGMDTQGWAGNYGCKMTGGSVIARIPVSLFTQTPGSECK